MSYIQINNVIKKGKKNVCNDTRILCALHHEMCVVCKQHHDTLKVTCDNTSKKKSIVLLNENSMPCYCFFSLSPIYVMNVSESDILNLALSPLVACNVLYINSVEMESLTGPQAIAKAISETLATSPASSSATIVHFKVSTQGITLTDNQRK